MIPHTQLQYTRYLQRISLLSGLTLVMFSACTQPQHDESHDHKGHHHKSHDHESHPQDKHKPAHHHSFDPERFAKRWEGPERDQEQRPDAVIEACGITQGMSVADLGAGTGYFVPHLSRAVGTQGQVRALDLEPKMVKWLQARIKREALTNARAEQVSASATSLESTSVDRILIVNVWHHIDQREAYLKHLVSRLKPRGALCIIEIKRDAPKGPPIQHRLSSAELTAELSREPRLEVSASPLKLPHQHLVIAKLK